MARGIFLSAITSFIISTWAFGVEGVTNAWTKVTSGYWEEPYWSVGELPSLSHALIAVTNEGWKAVAIGGNTVTNYPASLHIKGLMIDAPTNSANLLLLNYAGLSTVFEIDNDIVLGPNGSLLSYYSALRAHALTVNNRATFAEYGQSQFTRGVFIGANTPGEVNLSNGWFYTQWLLVSGGAAGVFNQSGGTNRLGDLSVYGNGVYNLSAGVLEATNTYAYIHAGAVPGTARMNVSGGSAEFRWGVELGQTGRGELSVSGGTLKAPSIIAVNGGVVQTGGRMEVGDLDFRTGGYSGASQYWLSNGILSSEHAIIDSEFIQAGGIHTNSQEVRVYRRYELDGGTLVTPSILVEGGEFAQGGGTNHARIVEITYNGRFGVGGGELSTSNTIVRSRFALGQATHNADTLTIAGRYDLGEGSTLLTRTIELPGEFWCPERVAYSPPAIRNERFVFQGGTLFVQGSFGPGSQQFGLLVVSNNSGRISMWAEEGRVDFLDSRAVDWGSSSRLIIENWRGSTNGSGRHVIKVGSSSQALTATQVSRIRFLFHSNALEYTERPARILGTGEIVPAEFATPNYRRTQGGLVLTWPPGYQLFSSTNVSGPYMPIPVNSPYTNLLAEPRRFFYVQPYQ